jgi:hypothetical protein
VEAQPKNSKSPAAAIGSPGIVSFGNVGNGPIRGIFEMNEIAYVVSGTQFYSIDSAGTGTLLGDGITGFSPVSIGGNGFEIVIRNGTLGFSYLVATMDFSQISDGDFQQGNTVTVINNIFAYDWLDTNKFFISAVLDGRSYDALDFASAESHPDYVLAVKNQNGVLMVFGAHTIEPWDNTGAADFPFSRIKGATIERGVESPLAIVSEDSSLFILGNDLIFYRLNGTQLQRISTHALETEWQKYTTTSDAFCFSISINGHKWVVMTFPTEGTTWVWDIATSLWHERVSYDSTGIEVKWRINCACDVYGKTLVGDDNSNSIGYLDPEVYTEFGDPIISVMTSSPVYDKGKQISVPCLEVDFEGGVGLTTGQGIDPQVMMDYSIDGGFNFTAPQQWRTMGVMGARNTRFQWQELGCGYQFVFRLSISDPVKRVMTGARILDYYSE